jgi:hypothetical protein
MHKEACWCKLVLLTDYRPLNAISLWSCNHETRFLNQVSKLLHYLQFILCEIYTSKRTWCQEGKHIVLFSREWATHPHLYLAEQVSLSLDLCDQPTNKLEARLFHWYFLLKCVHKIVANGFWSFYCLCWLW